MLVLILVLVLVFGVGVGVGVGIGVGVGVGVGFGIGFGFGVGVGVGVDDDDDVGIGVSVLLTLGAVNAVPSRLAVLTRCAVETFVATTLPVAVHAILTHPVVGAPAADVSGAFEALVAIKTRAAVVNLQHRAAVSLFSLFMSKKY